MHAGKGLDPVPGIYLLKREPNMLASTVFPIKLLSIRDEEELRCFAGGLQECQDYLSALTRELESGVMGDAEQDFDRIKHAWKLQTHAGKPCHAASALAEDVTVLHMDWTKLEKVEEGLSVEESLLVFSTFLRGICKAGSESFGAFKLTSLSDISSQCN